MEIELNKEITIDEYLNHNIRLTYQLQQKTMTEPLMEKLKSGVIFKFPYSYRGGLEADAGIILMNDDDEIFFLVGDDTNVDYKGLQQAAPVAPADEESETESADLMDFGMI